MRKLDTYLVAHEIPFMVLGDALLRSFTVTEFLENCNSG